MADHEGTTYLRILVAFARPGTDSHVVLAMIEPAFLDHFIKTILGERPDRTPGIEPSTLALRSAWGDDDGTLVAEFWSNPDIADNPTYPENTVVTAIFGDTLPAPIRGNVLITGPADTTEHTIADTQDWALESLVNLGVVAHEVDGTTRVTMADLLRF